MKSYNQITHTYLTGSGLSRVWVRDVCGVFRLHQYPKGKAQRLVAEGKAREHRSE